MHTITAKTQEIIDHLADYDVEETYGRGDKDGQKGARLIALAVLKLDLNGQVEPQHLDAVAHTELSIRTRAALEARRCQCPQIGESGVCRHGDYPAAASWTTKPRAVCPSYFELDVPEVDGAKLCGTCYIATADERGLSMAEQ